MKEFLDNPEYTAVEDRPRPANRKLLIEFFDSFSDMDEFEKLGKYEEMLYIAGIGSGKSFSSSKAIQYVLYRLLCLRNPQQYFSMAPGSKIAFINISKSFSQAKDVVFGEIKNRIDNSTWFQTYYPPDPKIKSVMKFAKSIFLLPLGSNEEAPLGYNIFGAVIDEASFHVATKDKDYAEESYNQIKKRLKSRFFDKGKVLIITSPKYVNDFAERKFNEDDNPKLFKRRAALWDVMPPERFSGEKFDIGNYLEEFRGIMCPVEYEQDFKQNPERAMRDYGAQPSLAIEAFFRDPSSIKRMINLNRENPWDPAKKEFKEWFMNRKSLPNYDSDKYFIHCDLGLNKGGKGDFAGIVMGKFNGWQEFEAADGKKEKRPKIFISYMERIEAGPREEIMFSDVRKRIYAIKDYGWNISLVSLDGWQSIDMIQTLNSGGIHSETFSVDRTPEAYYTLKAALLEGRLDYFGYKPLIEELSMLEEIKGSKIDHPRLGHKDVSDAAAAVCWHCAQGKPGIGIYGVK